MPSPGWFITVTFKRSNEPLINVCQKVALLGGSPTVLGFSEYEHTPGTWEGELRFGPFDKMVTAAQAADAINEDMTRQQLIRLSTNVYSDVADM